MDPEQLTQIRSLAEANPTAAARVLEEVKAHLLTPHSGGQSNVIGSQARFRVVRAGRRWGKTKVAAHETVKSAVLHPGSMNWWVANRWRNTRRGFKEVVRQLPPSLLAKKLPSESANELNIYLRNGSVIEFYSGESPDSLAGEGVNWVVMDEAALQRVGVWDQLIRPTLMDTGGKAMLISTPRGRNWFYDADERGNDPTDPSWESFHYPQWLSPYIPQEETDAARRDLPELLFQQEIAAEFVSNAASIFLLPDGSVVDDVAEPEGVIVMGVDWAKKEDFTVMTASNAATRMPCFHHRLKDLDWPTQRGELLAAVRYLEDQPAVEHVQVFVDATGGSVGDVILDELEGQDIDVTGIQFSQPWKVQAVKKLSADLQQGDAHILECQREEFESYEYELGSTGLYKFAAARGHDDEVSAKLLEHWGMAHEPAPDVHVIDAEDASERDTGEVTHHEDAEPDDWWEIAGRDEAWN